MRENAPGPNATIMGWANLTAEEAYDNGYRLGKLLWSEMSEGLQKSYLDGHRKEIEARRMDYGYWSSMGFLDGYKDSRYLEGRR